MVMGQQKVIFATLASVSNADTYATGLTTIDHVNMTPTTAVAVGCTISGGTITLANAGTIALSLMVYGTP
jgi:hypothetical protein